MRCIATWSFAVIVVAATPLSGISSDDQSPEERQVKGIIAALEDDHIGVRLRAAKKLAQLLGASPDGQKQNPRLHGKSLELASEAKVGLRRLLQEGDSDAKVQALVTLSWLNELKGTVTVQELLQLLKAEGSSTVRVNTAQALTNLAIGDGGDAARKVVRQLLKDQDQSVRSAIIQALGVSSHDRDLVNDLKELLDNSNPEQKAELEAALARLGEPGRECARCRPHPAASCDG